MTKKLQLAYKGNKCAGCGLSVQEMLERYGTFQRMTEFHHIDPKKKHKKYSNIIRQKLNNEQLNELDKCVLLCSNCHAVVHAQNIQVFLKLSVDLNGQTYTQNLKGQMILDLKNRRGRIFIDETLKLGTYIIKVGDSEPVRVVGLALENVEYMRQLISSVKSAGRVRIWDEVRSKYVCALDHIDDDTFRYQQDVSFSLVQIGSCDDLPKFWIRNGVYLDEEGRIQSEGKIDAIVEYASIQWYQSYL